MSGPALGLDNNPQVVDLSDLDGPLPLDVVSTTWILWQTGDREHSTWPNPDWPRGGPHSVAPPSPVRNDRGPNADGKYDLFYAHHDPRSGIGVAVSDGMKGPFSKKVNVPGRAPRRVVPAYHAPTTHADDPDHSTSPWVMWNEQQQLWFMYLHYYNHRRDLVPGYQLIAIAITVDLSSHDWTIWRDADDAAFPPCRPVLATAAEP